MTRTDPSDAPQATEARMPPALPLDPARYAAELAAFDLTAAQAQELLATLWSIMRSFVELGFTVDVCGALLDETISVTGEDDLS